MFNKLVNQLLVGQQLKQLSFDIFNIFMENEYRQSQMLSNQTLNELAKSLYSVFPKLSKSTQKGDSGKIAIIGGSRDFTGAPYYAAISALKVGADLAQIFCSYSAAIPIKSYSPQIMVTPVFCSLQQLQQQHQITSQKQRNMIIDKTLDQWVHKLKKSQRISSWVIGPGLGRDPLMTKFFPRLLNQVLPKNSPIVFDADGLFHLTAVPELFVILDNQFTNVMLTPNLRQFKYVARHIQGLKYQNFVQILKGKLSKQYELQQKALLKKIIKVSDILYKNFHFPGNLFLKGYQDHIIMRNSQKLMYLIQNKSKQRQIAIKIAVQGGAKRCGGIGDILSGILGVLLFWNKDLGPIIASQIVRIATKMAFEAEARSMTAPNVIQKIGKATYQVQKYYLRASLGKL